MFQSQLQSWSQIVFQDRSSQLTSQCFAKSRFASMLIISSSHAEYKTSELLAHLIVASRRIFVFCLCSLLLQSFRWFSFPLKTIYEASINITAVIQLRDSVTINGTPRIYFGRVASSGTWFGIFYKNYFKGSPSSFFRNYFMKTNRHKNFD